MEFLIQIDGLFYGYYNIWLLSIDLHEAEKNGCDVGLILQKQVHPLKTIYKPISREDFEAMLEHERILQEERAAEWDYEQKKALGMIPVFPGDI